MSFWIAFELGGRIFQLVSGEAVEQAQRKKAEKKRNVKRNIFFISGRK